jgi:hypothetical protein
LDDADHPAGFAHRSGNGHRGGFVHHQRRYTYFFHSNHMLAAWLEQLGCQLRGPAYGSQWSVEDCDGAPY